MKVAVLHGPGDLRLDDAQRPTAGPGDLIVKVAAAGICGTDLHFRNMGPRFSGPMPLGDRRNTTLMLVGRLKPGTSIDAAAAPLDQLKAVVRWVMRVQLDGEMPTLPAQDSALRAALVADPHYLDRLTRLSDLLGEWIVAAQASAALDPELPPEVVLYRIFATACDPVLALLKAGGNHDDARIVDMLVAACFGGLCGARTT